MNAFIDKYFVKQPRLRRWITRLLEGEGPREVELFGLKLNLNSVKEHGYLRASRMARRSSLFRDEVAVLINLAAILQPTDTFVDIGANIGIYTCIFARLRGIFPALRVYAFEANPDTFFRLTLNCRDAGVEAHQCALSEKEGTLDFVSGAVSHVFTTVHNASGYSLTNERATVACKRLDSFRLEGDSIVLKIDVEGQERDVLEGAEKLFHDHRVKAVYLDGYKDRGIAQIMIDRGFTLYDGRSLKPDKSPEFSLLALRDGFPPVSDKTGAGPG